MRRESELSVKRNRNSKMAGRGVRSFSSRGTYKDVKMGRTVDEKSAWSHCCYCRRIIVAGEGTSREQDRGDGGQGGEGSGAIK